MSFPDLAMMIDHYQLFPASVQCDHHIADHFGMINDHPFAKHKTVVSARKLTFSLTCTLFLHNDPCAYKNEVANRNEQCKNDVHKKELTQRIFHFNDPECFKSGRHTPLHFCSLGITQ